MIDEGIYKGTIAGPPQWSQTPSGSDFLSVAWRLPDNHVYYWSGFLTEKTIDRTVEVLEALGWQGGTSTDELVGAEADVVIRHEEYEGKTTCRVAFVNTGGNRNALEPAMASRVAERAAAKMLAMRRQRGQGVAVQHAQPAPSPIPQAPVPTAQQVPVAPAQPHQTQTQQGGNFNPLDFP